MTTRADRAASPTVPADKRDRLAERAQFDAMDLAVDVRDADPRIVWGRLARWSVDDPMRLMACCWAAAAMVPVDQSAAQLLAWTEHLGGAA